MKATFKKDREFSNGIITLEAKQGNQKDIQHMGRVIAHLVEQEGYEEIYGEEDYLVTLGISADNTREAKEAYAAAKKATR